ncbi:hypothetical protein VTJ04DRAFT_9880 [Mycothermus thermophilus]|uniref:uncharacterized protein n=1 Tax=Humicola insolens TaxID=85995 RepID=UPI003742E626
MIPYSVYYVDVERLVREVLDLKASSDDVNSTSPAPGYSLGPDQLPTKWAFGMSGRCDYFTLTSPSDSSTSPEPESLYCQREFLPSQDIATVIEDALRNGFEKAHPVSNDPEYVINKVLDVWRWILDLPSLRHIPQQALKARMWMRSSAGLTIASVISDFLGPGITISKELSHGRLFLIFLIPTVLSAAAVACVVQTARTGMGGLWEVNKVGFAWFAPAVGAGVYGVPDPTRHGLGKEQHGDLGLGSRVRVRVVVRVVFRVPGSTSSGPSGQVESSQHSSTL